MPLILLDPSTPLYNHRDDMLDFWIKEVDSWYYISESRKGLEDLV